MSENPLGEKTKYPLAYDPGLLFPIPRSPARSSLDIENNMIMHGIDHWRAYEISWLDQTKKIIPKWVTYNQQGKPFKLFTKDRWKQIDGVWIAEVGSVRNLITRRKTTIITLQEHLNIPVDNENYFTQRVLTDGVFQNRLFNKMHQLFH